MLSRRTLLGALATSAVASAVGSVAVARPAAAQTYSAYVMGYFKESPDQSGDSYALHLAVSDDGLNWMPLNQNHPVATPTAGTEGLRDPFILRKQDGTFVVLATDLKGRVFNLDNQYIHVWDSANLTGFTGYRRVHLHNMNTHSWAPTAFFDPARGQYGVVYSARTGGRDVLMVNYTTDFVNMGSPQVFFDPGFNVLDGDVLVHGGNFYLAYKNLDNGNLYVSRSSTGAPNSFTTLTGGLRQGSAMEAPILVASSPGGETVRYEAEDAPATCDGTIDSNHAGYSGTGFCNTPNATGTAAQFTVTAASAGEATVRVGFANGSSGGARGADVVVNGSTATSTSFENTGGWSAWGTKTLTVPLGAGENTIRLVATGSGGLPNIDYLDLVLTDDAGAGTFWLWGDSYQPDNAVFYAWQNGDIDQNSWSVLSQRDYTAPINAKHATIIPISAAERSAMVDRWGAPEWNRLKSYNFPDRYVRHADYTTRIDHYPMDPAADHQWRLRPGLADGTGVSFESVNAPGRYLRHSSYVLRLDQNDGSSLFAADATFHPEAGLADATWTSFRSHNFPDRHIRHSDYVLRIDPISTATARADATFQVTY